MQLTPKMMQQLLRPIVSDMIGYVLVTKNPTTFKSTLANVRPNERSLIGKHSTVQMPVSGTIPMAEINMMNDMQMIGVQWSMDTSMP